MVMLLLGASYALFGLGVSVGMWIGDSEVRDETPMGRAGLALVGMLVWPLFVWREARDAHLDRGFDD